MKAYVEAYGCTLNFGEATEVEDMLSSCGFRLVDSPEECDLAVLVTCVVIETTERAMVKRIRALSSAPKLVVTGCMATACRERAEHLAPHALFVAPGDIGSLKEMVSDEARPGIARSDDRGSPSIVPIATGCRGSCAYCITRLARGELRSRSSSQIVSAAAKVARSGPREIQLTAQDTAAYGADIGTDLPALIDGISALPGDFRLRIGMMNPRSALPIVDKLAAMYTHPKVFKFVHLPVQSGSDAVLALMERGYTISDFKHIVSEIRRAVPETTLSTDVIVGYPGESDRDHRANLDLVSTVEPDIVNVTRFSPRPGTKAAGQMPTVPGWEAKERSRALTKLRFEIALARNTRFIGRHVRALATERGKSRSTILRTDEYKQVVVGEELELGKFYEPLVEEARPTYLVGALVPPGQGR